jgi:hypothetical protein
MSLTAGEAALGLSIDVGGVKIGPSSTPRRHGERSAKNEGAQDERLQNARHCR